MSLRRRPARTVIAAALLAAGPAPMLAQTAKTAPPDLRATGRALFMEHCARCHGTSGRGDGPVADGLQVRPTNLTRFARANGGVFPSEKTRRVIDGRGVASHGSVEMPVWGSVFKATAPDGDSRSVEQRIDAIVAYLESIQERVGDQ